MSVCWGGGSVEGESNQSVGELVKMDLGRGVRRKEEKERHDGGKDRPLYIAGVANGVAKA